VLPVLIIELLSSLVDNIRPSWNGVDATGIKLKGPEVAKLIKDTFVYDMIREIANPNTLQKNIKLFNLLKNFMAQLKRTRKQKESEQEHYLSRV